MPLKFKVLLNDFIGFQSSIMVNIVLKMREIDDVFLSLMRMN